MILECQNSSDTLLLSLEHVKAHLRLNGSSEDTYLESLIKTAMQAVENYLERTLLLKTYRYVVMNDPQSCGSLKTIVLPYPPLHSIVSVNEYFSDDEKKLIKRYMLTPNTMRPQISVVGKTIEVIYKAGYGETPEAVPPAIRHAVLECVAGFYENRGQELKEFSCGLTALLQPYRVMSCH